MRYRALVVGNSVFDDAALNPLNAPTKDVARLHGALVDESTGMFEEEDVRLVTERNASDILDELYQVFESATKDDVVLLYYSGHGLLDQYDQLYLAGRNTRPSRLLVTGVSNARINEIIEQSAAGRTVIVLDCCSAGMFKGGDVGRQLSGTGRYVLSSTRGRALANDAATGTGTSRFTEFLVAGLTGKAPDPNGDGFVDLREIYDHVKRQLESTTRQSPNCRFDGDGAFPLARVAGAARPRPGVGPSAATRPFELAEHAIVFRDIGPHEQLAPETVEIRRLGEEEVDCYAEASADWIRAEVRGGEVLLELRPGTGANRAKIVVRDRRTRYAEVLRVEAHVVPPPAAPPSPGTKSDAKSDTKSDTGSPSQYGVPPGPVHPQGTPSPGAEPSRPAARSARPNDPTAVAAFVTAVLAAVTAVFLVGGVFGVVALVLVRRAKKRLAASGGQVGGAGLATAAQVLGWVAVGLSLVMLVAVIFAPSTPT